MAKRRVNMRDMAMPTIFSLYALMPKRENAAPKLAMGVLTDEAAENDDSSDMAKRLL